MNLTSLLIGAAIGSAVTASLYLLSKPPASRRAVSLTLIHLEGGTLMLRIPAQGAIARFTLSATDAAGNAAEVENVQVTLSDPNLGSAGQGSDGDIRFTPSGVVGTVTLQVSADGRIGDGERLLFATAEIQVVAGEAAFLSLGNGTVEPTA